MPLLKWLSQLLQRPRPSPAHPPGDMLPVDVGASESIAPPLSIDSRRLPLDILARYVPLRKFDPEVLEHIPYTVKEYAAGARVFRLGDPAEDMLYLLHGSLTIQPNGEAHYVIGHNSTIAHLPLNSGQFYGATAVAETQVKLLCVSRQLAHLWIDKSREAISCVELVDIELPDPLAGSEFFKNFSRAYRENHLRLPTLPEVAIRLREAIQKDIGLAEAAAIIQFDPSIVTKLIQIANSPLYATNTPIRNCLDAVSRLGLEATKNLVIGISLKQLFHSRDSELQTSMRALWRNSLYVSSLGFVLAEASGSVNPDDALLAGLICDIGVIPLLHFAEENADRPDFHELEAAIPYLRGPVGTLVLHTLGFAEHLSGIPNYAEDWYYDSGPELTLVDIVILAKLHSLFGTKRATALPYVNTLPAYAKLRDGKLDPDFSLMALRHAKKRINSAVAILS